jgi:hypothetical protein
LTRRLSVMIGLRVAGCTDLTVENCLIKLAQVSELPLVAVGLLATGACAQMKVLGCRFDATKLGATQNPGLVQRGGFLDDAFVVGPGRRPPRGAIGILVTPGAANFLTSPDSAKPDVFTSVPDATGLVVENNAFNGLTTAVSAFGLLNQARVCDNTAVNCAAGIWLRPIEARSFNFAATGDARIAVAGDQMWLKMVLLQYEAFMAWQLGLLLPPPPGEVFGDFALPPAGGTLRVTGNNVGTVERLGGAADDGMPALAIVTGTFQLATDIGPGFIVAENRLQARTLPAYPCCVLALTGRLTVTGNLISNEQVGSPPRAAVSLVIYPDNNLDRVAEIPAPRICVTGNVLEGTSNLAALLRTDAGLLAGLNTWVPFNASA